MPLYSYGIAVTSKILGIDEIKSIRFFNAFCFGMSLLLLFTILIKHIKLHTLWSACIALLFALSPSVNINYMSVWSEALFGVLLLAILTLILSKTKRKSIVYALCGILLACLVLTRYAALPFILIFGCIVFLKEKEIQKKLFNTLLVVFTPILAFILWGIRNKQVSEEAIDRVFAFHPPGRELLNEFFNTIVYWFIPINAHSKLIFLGLVISMVVICLLNFKM